MDNHFKAIGEKLQEGKFYLYTCYVKNELEDSWERVGIRLTKDNFIVTMNEFVTSADGKFITGECLNEINNNEYYKTTDENLIKRYSYCKPINSWEEE